jgi:hypothetical protein
VAAEKSSTVADVLHECRTFLAHIPVSPVNQSERRIDVARPVALGDAEGYANERVRLGTEVGGLRNVRNHEAAQLHPAQPRAKCPFRHEPIRRIELCEQFA